MAGSTLTPETAVSAGGAAVDGRELMAAVAAETPGAFERLVAAYEARIRWAVGRWINDRSSTEDLAQEVLLRLYRSRHRYQPTARFETFLHTIIFNLCVNHTRYMRRRRAAALVGEGEDEGSGAPMPADPDTPAPLEEMQLAERARILREAIERLPESQRRAIELSRFENLSYDEICETMGLSMQAVKSLLWRARENLRRDLAPRLGETDERPS